MPTWEELGKPTGPPSVGQVIAYEGGTYELLPGEPRRYKLTDADGRDISNLIPIGITFGGRPPNQTADDARAALRGYAHDRGRIIADERSRWRKTLAAVPGSYSLETQQIAGFDAAPPARHAAIRNALEGWKERIFDSSRGVEPFVSAALRGRTPRTPQIDADIVALDDAFNLSRTSRAITVYRGVMDGQHILPADWQTRDLTGLEWTDEAPTATSVKKEFARNYVGDASTRGFGITIRLPQGSPAISLPDKLGGDDAEGEVVLPRKATFRVVKDNGRVGRFGMRWLDVEIVQSSSTSALKPQGRAAQRLRAAA